MEVRNRYCDKCKNLIVREPYWKMRIKKEPDKPIKMDLCDSCFQKLLLFFDEDNAQLDGGKSVQKPETEVLDNLEVKKATPHKRPMKRRNAERVMALRRAGLSNEQIAEEIGASKNIVAMIVYHFKKSLSQTEFDKVENIDAAKVQALHKAAWKDSKIADEMGVSEKYIRELLYVQEKYSYEK